MKKTFLFIYLTTVLFGLCIVFGGCSGLRVSYYKADNVDTIYGKGNVGIKAVTAWSLLKSMPNLEEKGIFNEK